jgi:hypothetical protein
MNMDKLKIVRFLNREYEKVKGEPSKIKGFYNRHYDIIDAVLAEASVPALVASGLRPELAVVIGMGEFIGLMGKWAYQEKKELGGSIWQAGMSRKRRLEEVI